MNKLGIIFRRTLIDYRKSIFWWGVGIGVLAMYVIVVFPLISEFEQFNELLDSPVFKALIGDAEGLDWTSPEGFLGIEFFSWTPLVLAVFAVLFGLNIVGGEESRGTLDVLLSTPIPRWRVIVEKFASYFVALLLINLISWIGMLVGILVTPDFDLPWLKVAAGVVNMMPPLMLMAALALFLTTVLPARAQAGGITAAIITASYFINSFAEMADSSLLKALQTLSFYKYYAPLTVMTQGVNWGYFALLTVVTVTLFGLSIYFFERRDISV